MSPGFFPIFDEKVRKPASHITGHMFYDYGNTIVLFPMAKMEIGFLQLGKGFVPQGFITGVFLFDVAEVMRFQDAR